MSSSPTGPAWQLAVTLDLALVTRVARLELALAFGLQDVVYPLLLTFSCHVCCTCTCFFYAVSSSVVFFGVVGVMSQHLYNRGQPIKWRRVQLSIKKDYLQSLLLIPKAHFGPVIPDLCFYIRRERVLKIRRLPVLPRRVLNRHQRIRHDLATLSTWAVTLGHIRN